MSIQIKISGIKISINGICILDDHAGTTLEFSPNKMPDRLVKYRHEGDSLIYKRSVFLMPRAKRVEIVERRDFSVE